MIFSPIFSGSQRATNTAPEHGGVVLCWHLQRRLILIDSEGKRDQSGDKATPEDGNYNDTPGEDAEKQQQARKGGKDVG